LIFGARVGRSCRVVSQRSGGGEAGKIGGTKGEHSRENWKSNTVRGRGSKSATHGMDGKKLFLCPQEFVCKGLACFMVGFLLNNREVLSPRDKRKMMEARRTLCCPQTKRHGRYQATNIKEKNKAYELSLFVKGHKGTSLGSSLLFLSGK